MDLMQLTFVVPVERVEWARKKAREYWQIPEDVVITREGFGFGDYLEYPLCPVGGTEPTHYACSDTYRPGTEYGQAEHFKAWTAAQTDEAWARPFEGDVRGLLEQYKMELFERKPEYPEKILGIDA